MNRRFGIELEISDITEQEALHALQSIGVQVAYAGRFSTSTSSWKIVPDGSVQSGFEIVSPILQGEAGLEEAKKVVETLNMAEALVNRSCGFHVHFDAADLSVDDIRSIVSRYADFETRIDACMPRSRRENNNRFCKSIISFLQDRQFQTARTIHELAQAQGCRYYKVNLQSYTRHGTLEFRQHSGTVNAKKVINWVKFLHAFIDESIRLARAPQAQQTQDFSRLTQAQRKLANLLTNGPSQGPTLAQQLGWLPHTLRAAITRLRQSGVDVCTERQYGVTTYRINTTTRPQDDLYNGIPAEVVSFYQRRAQALAA